MNAERRKAIHELEEKVIKLGNDERLTQAAELLTGFISDVEEIQEALREIQNEEQEYLDAMPESLQGGEKGERAQEAIDALAEADSALDDFIQQVNELSEVAEGNGLTAKLDEAQGALNNAGSQ